MHRHPIACILLLAGCVNVTLVDSGDAGHSTAVAERAAVASAAGANAASAAPIPAHQRDNPWYRDARQRVAARAGGAKASNVILFLGDGMGISTVTAARIFAGQRGGGSGEENALSFETFPVTGLIKTYNVNAQTPDSAGTMSAIMTGVKTDMGVFGVDEDVTRGDCSSQAGNELLSLLQVAELAGKATGVISTARLTHATPGATYASTVNRDWEDDSAMPEAARRAGCVDIAAQFVAFEHTLNSRFGAQASDGIEVAIGGGRRHFLPATHGGRRSDGRDLVAEWQAQYPAGAFVENAAQLAAASRTPLLGLLSDSHMAYASQRQAPGSAQPSLAAMTRKAIDLLEARGEGYLLIVEAGRIDHAHHAVNAFNALNDTVELAAAVTAALGRVAVDETLILVTADHSHVFTMAGYPRRGNPILGKVVGVGSDAPTLDAEGRPYTTLGYANGPGFAHYGAELNAERRYRAPPAPGRRNLTGIDTRAAGYHQEALVPLNAETHGGEDVAVYATGPGAGAAAGVNEQNLLFHVMLQATTWEQDAARRLVPKP